MMQQGDETNDDTTSKKVSDFKINTTLKLSPNPKINNVYVIQKS